MGRRASLDIWENRQFSCTCQETNHDCLVVEPLALPLYHLCYPGLKEAALRLTKRLDDPKASVGMTEKRIFLVLTVNETSLIHFPEGETVLKYNWCQELGVIAVVWCQ